MIENELVFKRIFQDYIEDSYSRLNALRKNLNNILANEILHENVMDYLISDDFVLLASNIFLHATEISLDDDDKAFLSKILFVYENVEKAYGQKVLTHYPHVVVLSEIYSLRRLIPD